MEDAVPVEIEAKTFQTTIQGAYKEDRPASIHYSRWVEQRKEVGCERVIDPRDHLDTREGMRMPGFSLISKALDWLGAGSTADGQLWMNGGTVTVLLDGIEVGTAVRPEGLSRPPASSRGLQPHAGPSSALRTGGALPIR